VFKITDGTFRLALRTEEEALALTPNVQKLLAGEKFELGKAQDLIEAYKASRWTKWRIISCLIFHKTARTLVFDVAIS
jgi:hypothetical protein